jgi:hypothetical protein
MNNSPSKMAPKKTREEISKKKKKGLWVGDDASNEGTLQIGRHKMTVCMHISIISEKN